jgi:hypothetical protein
MTRIDSLIIEVETNTPSTPPPPPPPFKIDQK